MKRHYLGIILVLSLISMGAFAAEPVIIIADVDRGLALVPEGTVLPQGITVRVARQNQPARVPVAAEQVAETDAAPAAKPLVFAYAPESTFAEARAAIAKRPGFAIESQASQWFYVYYWDGSHHGVRRDESYSGGYWTYGVYSQAYVSPNSEWYQSSAYVSQGGAMYFDSSTGCWFGTYGGYCAPGARAVGTSNPNYTATVDSEVIIARYRQSPCDMWGEPPCQEYFSSTITITFP